MFRNTKGNKGCLIIAWDHGGVNTYGSSKMKEIYEIYKKEFKISVIRDTKCLQDEDQLDQVASRSGQNIMSDFYSSNDFALLHFHVDICNEAELKKWLLPEKWLENKQEYKSQDFVGVKKNTDLRAG